MTELIPPTEEEIRAMSPVFVPLYMCWFQAFKEGKKTTEFRTYGPRWNERTCPVGRAVTLSGGYGKGHRLSARIVGFERKEGLAHIHLKLEPSKQ
jgi:hypothetical protein